MQSISDIRRDYTKSGLDTENLTADPLELFDIWLQNAVDAKLDDPTAMTVATVDPSGQPSQRIVLLKDVNQGGFVFYTNLGSKKADDLKHNSKISLHFPWHMLDRQVKISGTAELLSVGDVAKYFVSRPKPSQIAAWVSKQSRPIATRQLLMSQFNEAKQKFMHGEVPLPSFWGGYRVIPHKIEFWQGGEHRMHDRFVYTLDSNKQWQTQRLMP
ncbi:MAG: pyridoxamine 5'-phosphate oxidase [Paraglaciecola sp.]|uniref:pyridoxamine 5'-phosphate oxidase n=1 Tax=Paraglaciecola sp. TaxID=1920173 RepID=UPI00273EA9E1|nr:pyridoxamine 5'-phosphate oxidase [Paraglaciecola sp.]MDP5028937.1 pyridoxamine 5'-phosphate oxidase [Paraglaciecola sp.]MDP5132605.1 pyridoxamine 5'-phosphate oxidase [Paraglaciecola sp.]